MKDKKKQMFFLTCRGELVNTLTKEQKGDVLDALFKFASTGEKTIFEDERMRNVFSILCDDMEKEASHE